MPYGGSSAEMNKYIDVTAPWVLAKNKASRPQLDLILYNLLEGLRVVAGLVYPVMPDTAAIHDPPPGPRCRHALLQNGAVVSAWKSLTPGIQLPKSITLFPRVELKAERAR
jgi:methionyl-tRNA synthetase